MKDQFIQSFGVAALSPDPDLAVAALMIARVEYPTLDAAPYLGRLDELGREARRRVAEARSAPAAAPHRTDPDGYAGVMALNDYLFTELRFVGNAVRYEDPRNSFLNEVLDRRTGIPITLALLYMEVARRAGLHIEGINFPGHFLLRCPAGRGRRDTDDLIIDAFHGGALLSAQACRELLRRHTSDDEAELDAHLMGQATKPQILARMLLNLKRLYVGMHSFPQARDITDLMLAVNPDAVTELRDRGLLAYHLGDFPAALRDLQAYLQRSTSHGHSAQEREEHAQVVEHVNALRKRVASLN